MPHETSAVSTQVLCTPYNHAPCYFLQSHIYKVYGCLAVTCHMHFWQNDRDLSRATAVTRGWNGYQNKSQHRKSTLEKKISRRSCRDLNPRPFNHESGALTTELSPPRRSKHIAIPYILSGMSVTWCCVRHVCTRMLCQACLYPDAVSGMFVPGCCVRHVCTRVLCQACLYQGVVSGMFVPGCCVRHVCTRVLCQACLYPSVLLHIDVPWSGLSFFKHAHALVFCHACP